MKHELLPRDKKLRLRAAELRKNATMEENHLWYDFLRAYPVQFNRQRIIGEHITDFYCAKARLVIELDGMQHNTEFAMEYDSIRTAFFESMEVMVLRFSNREIQSQFEKVCETIDLAVKRRI